MFILLLVITIILIFILKFIGAFSSKFSGSPVKSLLNDSNPCTKVSCKQSICLLEKFYNYQLFVADQNFDGVPIVIIKQETKESCHCPCKGTPSDDHTATSSSSMILLDSGTFPQPVYTAPSSQYQPVLGPVLASDNNFVPYLSQHASYAVPPVVSQAMPQQFPAQSQTAPEQNNMLPSGMIKPVTGPETNISASVSNRVDPQLQLSPTQEFQFDQASNSSLYLPPVTDISYSPSVNSLNNNDYPESMSLLLDTIDASANVETSKACCDNKSILQCVTLGCGTSLEPKS